MPIEKRLRELAKSDPAEFSTLFKRTRESYPEAATRACIRHLAEYGLDTAGQKMQIWLLSSWAYLDLLLDPDFLSEVEAFRVAIIMRDASGQFSLQLQRCIIGSKLSVEGKALDRALRLSEKFGDPGVLIPWLRGLAEHPDHVVRAKAAKSLCIIRPTLGMIERQLKSADPRVRADAVEALWSRTGAEAIGFLEAALNDESHRVIVNALVGLHRFKISTAFDRLLALAQKSSDAMRCAAIWGLGFIADFRAIPTLKALVTDSSITVSTKASIVLERLLVTWELMNPVIEPSLQFKETHQGKPEGITEIPLSPTYVTPLDVHKASEKDLSDHHRTSSSKIFQI